MIKKYKEVLKKFNFNTDCPNDCDNPGERGKIRVNFYQVKKQ